MQIDPITPSPAIDFCQDSRRPLIQVKQASQPAEPVVTEPQIEKVVTEANQALAPFEMSLRFSKDADTGMIVVQIVDKSGQTVRQTPNEASLELAAVFAKLHGRLFNRQA
jgi:uncharacterized FlaG/YvyC family protein